MDLPTNLLTVVVPVGVVIVFALLVFAFGFKSSVEPPSFRNIVSSSDEKKGIKKKKVKDKKAQTNGHATVVIDLPESKKDSTKTTKQSNKSETPKLKKLVETEKPAEKKSELQKSPVKKEKKVGELKNKKNANEKPADFDEGEWETQPSRKDKKKKKDDDPVKDILAALTPEKVSKKKSPAPQKEKSDDVAAKVDVKETETIKEPVVDIPAAVTKKEKIDEPVKKIEAPVAEQVPAQVAATQPAANVTHAEPIEEQSGGKKKKSKKQKTSVSEDDAVVPEVAKQSQPAAPIVNENQPAFNELEETWKEAPQKKSKKKVRKD